MDHTISVDFAKGVGQVGGRVPLAVIALCGYKLYCSLPPAFIDVCLFLFVGPTNAHAG